MCRDVGLSRRHIVVIVADGLALQDVAIVEQKDVLCPILRPHPVNVGFYAGQRTRQVAAVDKVVGKETTVHVGSLYNLYGRRVVVFHSVNIVSVGVE